MKRYVILILIFSVQVIFGQAPIEHIYLLKEGTLIVRLIDNESKIKYYRENGNTELADAEEIRLDQLNKAIIKAFSEQYSFSKLRFTYGEQVDTTGNIKAINFVNETLEYDESLSIDGGGYYFLDLSYYEEYHNRAYILDRRLERIPRPFPRCHISRIKITFQTLNTDFYRFEFMASKINERLFNSSF